MRFDLAPPLTLPIFSWTLLTRWPVRVAMVLISLFGAIGGLYAPAVQKILIDRLSQQNGVQLPGLEWMQEVSAWWLVSLTFFAFLMSQGSSLLTNLIGFRESLILQHGLADALYKKMLSVRLDQSRGSTVGETVSIYATDVPGATAFVDQAIPMGTGIIFPLVLAPLVIERICGISVTYSVGVIVAVILVDMILARRQARFFFRYKQLAAERTGIVNEWVQNIRLLRILGWMEAFEEKIFRKRREETVNRIKMVTNGQMMGSFGSSVSFVINLTGVAALIQLRGKDITPGEILALLWIFGVFLARPFRQVPWLFTFSLDSFTSMKRIENFLLRPSDSVEIHSDRVQSNPQKPDASGICSLSSFTEMPGMLVRGLELEIDHQPILKNISFAVSPGEFVAIVGEVGSGKSMILQSLLSEVGARFLELKAGGRNLLKLSRSERRQHFSYVPQDGFVMSATLRENVAFLYGIESETDSKILQALSDAQFDLDQERVGRSLDIEIGERGVNLSGGQKQRISLARASYINRPIVLLDDCLSAIDYDTEEKLMQSLLFGAWKNKTRLLVTHRLTVLPKVDRVIFVKNGQVEAEGPFEKLKSNPTFAEFIKSLEQTAIPKDGGDGVNQDVESLP